MTDVGREASAELDRFEPCPHCRGRARLERHATYRWVCGVCGGPRVPALARAPSERGLHELRTGDEARKMAFAWRLWAIGLLLTGTLLAALGATLSVLSVAVSFALLLGAIAFFVGGAMAHRRAKVATEKAKSATFSAWESVAEEVLKARGGKVSARELAKELETTEEDVERMMTFLSADDRADVSLREAEVVYSARIPLRVDASALEEVGAAVAEREGDEETDGTSGRAASADERRR